MKITPESKKAMKKLSSGATGVALGWGAGAIGLGLTGVGTIPAAVAGAAALIVGAVAYGADTIAEDPPREDFDRCEICNREMLYKADLSRLSWALDDHGELSPFRDFVKESAVLVHGLWGVRKAIERYSGVQISVRTSNHEAETVKFLQLEALRANSSLCADALASMISLSPRINISWHQMVCRCGLDTSHNIEVGELTSKKPEWYRHRWMRASITVVECYN